MRKSLGTSTPTNTPSVPSPAALKRNRKNSLELISVEIKSGAINSHEAEVVWALRNMTEVDCGRIVRFAVACAEQRPKLRPALRLVSGGK